MEKKYILTDETIEYLGHTLHRIKAVKDFADISAGMFGGYVEREYNLGHAGNAWVADNAMAYDTAVVTGNARVTNYAVVSGHAVVTGNARVTNYAVVSGNAMVTNYAVVSGDAVVTGNARVTNYAVVSGNARVTNYAVVSGNARVTGDVTVSGNAMAHGLFDIALVKGFGSEFRATSFFRCVDGLVRCQCGCFYGTVDEFRSKVRETHGDSKYAKEYLMIADLMELHFKED